MANDSLDEWDIARGRFRSISAAEIKTFWNGYVARRQDVRIDHGSLYSRWRQVADDLVISLYLTNRSVGLFVRGARGERHATTKHRLSAYEPGLGLALGASLSGVDGCCYLSRLPLPMTDPECWPQAHEWLAEREAFYHRVLSELAVSAQAADR
ncbi:MAG: hypothetical protein WDZ83_13120 [Rhizobiaceae bacterium]